MEPCIVHRANKSNSKMAEMLTPWVQIHFSVPKQYTRTRKLQLQRNHHIAILSTSW